MKIKFFAVGGTIDKIYFDQKSEYQIGNPKIEEILTDMKVIFDFDCESILRKDSLDMTDADRQLIFDTVRADENRNIVITHGTDTMIETAKKLQGVTDKVIVLTGALEPADFKSSDAIFNIGSAVAAVQTLPEGVYITMSGRVFKPDRVRKNRVRNRFEDIQ